MKKLFLFSILAILLYSGCTKMPNDGIPVYVRIDSVVLSNSFGQAGNTHAISDLWMESDAENLGAYEYPIKIPVLKEGSFLLFAQAGVIMNGLSSIRYKYPFYFPDTVTVTANRGETFYWTPTFRYRAGTVFGIAEDFEASNLFNTGASLANAGSDPNVIYGNNCALLNVPAQDTNVITTQVTKMTVTNGAEVWVEIDYKNELPFTVGIVISGNGSNQKVPKISFYPSDGKWKKAYINFSPEVNNAAGFEYQLYVEAINLQNTGGKIYFDNIKFLSFN